MKILVLWTVFFGFCTYTVFSQNPLDAIGQEHNRVLQQLISCENINKNFYPFLPYSDYMKEFYENTITYGDPEALLFLDYVNLPFSEKQAITNFLALSDNLPIHQLEPLLDTLEKEAIKKKSSPISLGFWSVAKHSLKYWKTFKWKDDNKPPLLAVVKADALGLLKGIVFGAAFWIGSNFIFNVPDAIGILGGSTIAVGITALDSFRFSKKYKKRSES